MAREEFIRSVKDTILPCPFCGGYPYLELSHRAYVDGKPEKVTFVRCRRCNARTSKVKISDYGHTSCSADASRKAIELWNRRVK